MLKWISAAFLLSFLLSSCTPSPSPISQTAEITGVTELKWTRVPNDEMVFGGPDYQGINSVALGGPGLVAVGVDSSGGDDDGAVWTSVDGRTWSRVPHEETVFGGDGDQQMLSITSGGPGLVAVGFDSTGGDFDAAVWTSSDGLAWMKLPDQTALGGPGDQPMLSITSGGPGLVAVGFDSADGDLDAAVWTSVDGQAWTRLPHDDTIFGGQGDQVIRSIVAGGPGLIAVGGDSAGEDYDAAVWTSVDGLTWARVAHDETIFGGSGGQVMFGLTLGGPGLVAIGAEEITTSDPDAAVWTSVDGLTWMRVAHDAIVFGGPGDQLMISITGRGLGVVAGGWDSSGGDYDAALWTSVDGQTWIRMPDEESIFGGVASQEIFGLTAFGTGLVAVGSDSSGDDRHAAVWIETEVTK